MSVYLKIWVWIKHNWYLPAALLFALVVYIITRPKKSLATVIVDKYAEIKERERSEIKSIKEKQRAELIKTEGEKILRVKEVLAEEDAKLEAARKNAEDSLAAKIEVDDSEAINKELNDLLK